MHVLQRVYDNQMRMLHKPIEALRSGDPLQIADFEDMMPTKDQVSKMMSYDLTRRAKRADLKLFVGGSSVREEAQLKPKNRSVVGVKKESDAHLPPGTDLEEELLSRGWIDDDPVW